MSRPRYVPLIVSSALLVGCTAPAARKPAPSPPAGSPAAVPVPPGSRLVTCEPGEAHVTTTRTPDPADVTAGALSWPGLTDWATADPAEHGSGDGDYKLGAVVGAGAVVTVTVPESHREVAGLRYGQQAGYRPTASVTFQGCAHADTAYIGGFHVAGRRCVPFDVTGPGQPPARIVVSFFAGPCR